MSKIINNLKHGVVVSCQAFENEPLYGSEIMAKMAKAAELGGAKGIRSCWPGDIRAIRRITGLPIIGINKIMDEHTDIKENVIITPDFESAKSIKEAGADIIALDCTNRNRDWDTVKRLISRIKNELNVPVMADISTLEEGIYADAFGADIISTTLSGYTNYSTQKEGPDLKLVEDLVSRTQKPINAEGRYWTIEQMIEAFERGAWMITIGGAITRPHLITKRFADVLEKYIKNKNS